MKFIITSVQVLFDEQGRDKYVLFVFEQIESPMPRPTTIEVVLDGKDPRIKSWMAAWFEKMEFNFEIDVIS